MQIKYIRAMSLSRQQAIEAALRVIDCDEKELIEFIVDSRVVGNFDVTYKEFARLTEDFNYDSFHNSRD